MKLNLFSIIVLLGAVQALLLGITLLLSKAPNKLQQRALAFFMLVSAYNGFETLNWSANINSIFFDFFTFTPIFAAGPCVYIYIYSFIHPQKPKHLRRYFLPVWIMAGLRILLWTDVLFFLKGLKHRQHACMATIFTGTWVGSI